MASILTVRAMRNQVIKAVAIINYARLWRDVLNVMVLVDNIG